MKCVLIFLIAVHAIICSATVHPSPYNPVFEYDVPVASQPIVYPARPAYYKSYGYSTPAVSHSYSHSQTHPTSYASHAAYYGGASGHYYAPSQHYGTSRYYAPYGSSQYYAPGAYGAYGGYGSYGAYGYAPAYSSAYATSYAPRYSPAYAAYTATPAYAPVAYTATPAYGPAAFTAAPATSKIEQTRLVVPATPKIYRYKASYKQSPAQFSNQSPAQYNNNQAPAQYQNQAPRKNFQGQNFEGQNYQNQRFQGSPNQQYYSQPAQAPYNNQYNFNGQNNRQVYAGSMPYTNNGEQVKLRRYQIYRPGIKKEFYDIEERTIVRPAGSALIELDPPTKKQDVTNYEPYGKNYGSNNQQFNSNGYKPNQFGGSSAQNEQFYVPIQGIPDCGGHGQTPVYEYGPPSTFDGPQTTYHPTTFHPTTPTPPQRPQTPPQRPQRPQTPSQRPQTPTYPTYTPTTTPQRPTYPTYPTTTPAQTPTYPTYHPSKTYQPPYTDSTYSSTSGDFAPSTTYSSTPVYYAPTEYASTTYPSTPGQYTPTTTASTTPQTSDIFISSTTPVSVTIVDKNDGDAKNDTQFQDQPDIYYAGQGQSSESPDQFQNELPPRGDISQYRAEQPDQFYHELPRSRYTNEPTHPPGVYTKSRGDPSEDSYYSGEQAEVVEIQPKGRNSTNSQNSTSPYGNKQQARLIHLYTGSDGGLTEIGQSEEQYNSQYTGEGNKNAQYQDAGKVRARVVAVTPPPDTATPTETVSRRRIVVSKPVTTVQEVVEQDNSTGTATSGNYQAKYSNGGQQYQNGQYQNGQYQNGQYQNGANGQYQSGANGQYRNEANGQYQNGANGQYQNGANAQYQNGANAQYQSGANGQYQNGANGQYQNGENGQYRSSFEQSNSNGGSSENYKNDNDFVEYSEEYDTDDKNANFSQDYSDEYSNTNAGSQSKKANFEESATPSSTGVFISTTPTSAKQRIIYVQPVSQNFAEQKAIPPKTN